jgi:hypothetical protein
MRPLLRLPSTRRLELCAACAEPFVQAREVVGWRADGRLVLDLACASCGWEGFAARPAADLDALQRARDRHSAAIAAAADALAMTSELDRIDRFALALQEDQILPEDF